MRALVLSLLLLSTAAFAGKDKVDPHSFGSVALFGFGGELDIEATQTSSGVGAVDAVNAMKESSDTIKSLKDGSAKSAAQLQSERTFLRVEKGLEDAFGWDVLDLDAMVAQPAYAELWDTKTPEINKKFAGWGSGMAPTGVLYKDLARMLKQEERDALMEALGLDHIVIASLTISGEDQGVSIGGVGTSRIKPKTLVMLTVYKKGEKKPVWKGSAVGKKTDEAIKADFGKASEGESEIVLQSIDKAMVKLKEKYAP